MSTKVNDTFIENLREVLDEHISKGEWAQAAELIRTARAHGYLDPSFDSYLDTCLLNSSSVIRTATS